jgi:7-carboxy-7-deazaguanine synthase
MIQDAATLPVVETFHSLQGEGHHSGRSAFFIRLAGCNVGCPWCDTKHSWPTTQHPSLGVDDLAEQASRARHNGAAFIVITGGEPLHQDLAPLTEALNKRCALPIHLETSGVDPLTGHFDWITLSPKRHRPPLPLLLRTCHELKVVVHTSDDIAFAKKMESQCPASTERLLQPGWNCSEGEQLALEHVRRHPNWRLSLQTHKWLAIQ